MKKILIATTALVATAGVAAAEVAVSGNGRMGVVYDGADLNFSSRIRVVFTLSGETDGGLQFGGSFRADNATGAATGNAGNVYISGAFGKLAMGDVVGAAEEVIGDLPEIGFQDVANNDVSYLTGDNGGSVSGTNALYTYSAGALSFALSMNDGKQAAVPAGFALNTTTGVIAPVAAVGVDTANEVAVGVKYSMDAYSVALAHEVSKPVVGGARKHTIIGATGTFADTTVMAFYGAMSGGTLPKQKQYGIGVTSKFDAITVKGFVRNDKTTGLKAVTSWGLGGEYSLGGGASVAGGLADNNVPGSKVKADFGLKFTF
ncbi:porin [Pseudorhodobacter sp. E13]|uniref:porin n=1 Tax=Pseudorhodobacter sp. E13 TaxID=2487931 RepID=UPI000F8E838D|nr:porin [Pseudorhodobacter sp. E13]RUS59663.1 porin [Pseudorhodobacter sp. E13]